jgi:hypothetical protein
MRAHTFADLPQTAVEHFNLYFYAAVLQVIEKVSVILGSFEAAFEQFPFLVGYNNELAEHGLAGFCSTDAVHWWRDNLREWEKGATGHLPLRALNEAAALEYPEMIQLLTIGLVEEDARFGVLFESLQGLAGQHRPTLGLLNSFWSVPDGHNDARGGIRRLQELGLIQVINQNAPRYEWAFQIPGAVWDAMRGEKIDAPANWAHHQEAALLPDLAQVILPDPLRNQLQRLLALIAAREVSTMLLRGPQHNGRRTLVRAMARSIGCGLLEISGVNKADDERWKLAGPLATLLNAMPVVVLDLAPGETVELPGLNGYEGPLAIVLGNQGSVSGRRVEHAITITVEMPDVGARRQHWLTCLGPDAIDELDAVTGRFRLTSGNIRRAAGLALSYAALENRVTVSLADVQEASRALNHRTLDTLAARLNVSGDWSQLAVAPQTLAELYNLESRCRHRERLQGLVGPALATQLNVGVRALFSGPSGTGKTLAARLLASMLKMDVYRLDLSAVVNKYIGETEKSLNQVFSRAEELNVILLLDEGDALLTARTSVQTSNDRYANLETNFLLQRLETFEGILIVTTNAVDRIDGAFRRRMDVVVDFRPPDAAERWTIWQLHLPVRHVIEHGLMKEVAGRCALTGGQIRNAALNASLLALEDGGVMTSSHLESAVRREYRKLGAVCPLRQ